MLRTACDTCERNGSGRLIRLARPLPAILSELFNGARWLPLPFGVTPKPVVALPTLSALVPPSGLRLTRTNGGRVLRRREPEILTLSEPVPPAGLRLTGPGGGRRR